VRWLALIAVAGCSSPAFDAPQRLGDFEISPELLEEGRILYLRNCATCHGVDGDGNGPSSAALWPPPRDFTKAQFKYAGIVDRGLPADDELARIITGGLEGTAMAAWDLPEAEVRLIIDYIKTFSPPGTGFRDPTLKVFEPLIPDDPFVKEPREAVLASGERVYHAVFQCSKCHPAYVPVGKYADGLRGVIPFDPVPKWSENFDTVLLPPDFLRHPLRSVRRDQSGGLRADDLFRVIAYGLQGPMPGHGNLGVPEIWAVAHYVKHLAELRATPAARELRESLK
jgi:mono/diheme cytochrome c family protein